MKTNLKIFAAVLAALACISVLCTAVTAPTAGPTHRGGPQDLLGYSADYLQQLLSGSAVVTAPTVGPTHRGGPEDLMGYAADYLQEIRDTGLGSANDWKQNVRLASTANVADLVGTANDLEAGDAIDGGTLAAGDRVLLKDQSAPAENGIWIVTGESLAPTRATDADAWDEITGSAVVVNAGTVNAGHLWINTNVAGGTLNTTAITYTEISGTAESTASYGGIRWATPAATSNAAATPIKVAGTTAAQGTASDDITQGTANRITYTGEDDKVFFVTASATFTAAAATNASFYIYKEGALVTGSTLTRAIADTGALTVTISGVVTLSTDDYLEVWCETDDADDLTAQSGTLAAFTIDGGGGGSGENDVTAASAFGTDEAILRADGTDKGAKASILLIDDSGAIKPEDAGAGSLGTVGLPFADLFLASAAEIDFDGSDVKITHSANTLTVSGGNLVANGPGITLDASGFDGNLAVTDNTFQEIAQKLDDLSLGATDFDALSAATEADIDTDDVFAVSHDGTEKKITLENLVDLLESQPFTFASMDVTTLNTGTIVFEGATADADETTIAVVDPTEDRTFTLPDASGTAVLTGSDVAQAINLGGDTSLEIPNGADPDVDAEGEISYTTDDETLRVYDGTNQRAIKTEESIQVTVIAPNDLADSERDAMWVWENDSGMTAIVIGWSFKSDTDDTTLNIEEIDGDGQNNATVDAVEIATNGTGIFTASDTTITAATIESGHLIVLDFDDTDTPGQVKGSIRVRYVPN